MSDDLLQKIYDRQEKIIDDVSDIKVIIAKQESNIDHHIRRTDLLEENVDILRAELTPIKSHVDRVEGALKFLGGLSILATIGKVVYDLLK